MRRVDFDITAPSSEYSALIGERIEEFSDAILSALRGRNALILSDGGASSAALDAIKAILDGGGICHSVLILNGGERAKSFSSLDSVLTELIGANFTRNDIIINLGGGVIGDLGGFAASIYMRGIDYINIPTTMLSMIDSSIGGKTGIDRFGVKNIIGAFHQPQLVICATRFLDSLPEREIRSGFGEALKYYCLSASADIESAILARHADSALIEECCKIKRDCVCSDVLDFGRRRLLNLGHTFGHAFEASSGFELSHGEAVAMGLVAVMRFGEQIGFTERGVAQRIEALVTHLGMSADYSEYSASASEFITHDKKKDSACIEMAFIESFGKPLLRRVPIEAAAAFLLSSAM